MNRVERHVSIGSTQDRAFELGPGWFVLATEQTRGRGRLGRSWSQSPGLGVGVSMAVEADRWPIEQWSVRGGVAAARACEALLARTVGIKWPNDILVDGRKLAGVLVEVRGGVAVIGVGVNVGQQAGDWPSELATRAVSLAMQGIETVPEAAGDRLIDALAACAIEPIDAVVAAWQDRDALCGTTQRFRERAREVVGVVEAIEPLSAIRVRTQGGPVTLDPRLAELIKP